MKNKRYKRQAKRLKGTCISSFGCVGCNCRITCTPLFVLHRTPPADIPIRQLETDLKGGK